MVLKNIFLNFYKIFANKLQKSNDNDINNLKYNTIKQDFIDYLSNENNIILKHSVPLISRLFNIPVVNKFKILPLAT